MRLTLLKKKLAIFKTDERYCRALSVRVKRAGGVQLGRFLIFGLLGIYNALIE